MKQSEIKVSMSSNKKSPSNSYANYDAQLDEWSKKLSEFKRSLTQLNSNVQTDAAQKLEDLEKKYSIASIKMNELKSKGEIAKDEMKISFEKAWKELLQAYETAKKTFH